MRTEEQIKADMLPFEMELHVLREKAKKKEQTALLGKCFRYRNSYGSGRPSWWLYTKVIKTGQYWPVAFQFQTDCDGRIEIKHNDSLTLHRSENCDEITPAQFNAEWRKVQKAIARMKP